MPKLGNQQVPEENIVGEILLSKNKEQKLQAKFVKKNQIKININDQLHSVPPGL